MKKHFTLLFLALCTVILSAQTDSDGDGFPDDVDECPKEYGFLHGCLDSDGDGVPNKIDLCKYEAGNMENNGCPDLLDSDGDGVPDKVDPCPKVRGEARYAGCLDTDGDGVPDNEDICFTEKGSPANNGCPYAARNVESHTETIGGVYFVMKLVEGGTFSMGCTEEQGKDCKDDEKPSHSVTLTTFMIGETEVTQEFWYAVMGNYPTELAFPDCPKCPMERVSWFDVKDFIKELNVRFPAHSYRLPTEAEWEFASRGGLNSKNYKYSGGNDIDSLAWYNDNSRGRTHPVMDKIPNELGLYGMSGNVYEWCQDWYKKDYYFNCPNRNPRNDINGPGRVVRGGSLIGPPSLQRTSDRHYGDPGHRERVIGFRLARDR